MSHTRTPDTKMKPIDHESRLPSEPIIGESMPETQAPGRLEAIHDLVRSGGYHVPARAIADRIVEQMIHGRRRREA